MREKRPEFKSEAAFNAYQAERAQRFRSAGVPLTVEVKGVGLLRHALDKVAKDMPDIVAKALRKAAYAKPSIAEREGNKSDERSGRGHSQSPALSLVLPWPPSGNNGTKHTTTGQHYLTEPHKRFRKAVKSICLQVRAQPVPSPYRCTVQWFAPDRRERDSDNLQKVLFDALRHAGVISGDSLRDKVEYHEIAIIPTKPRDGAVHVRIESA